MIIEKSQTSSPWTFIGALHVPPLSATCKASPPRRSCLFCCMVLVLVVGLALVLLLALLDRID